MKPMTDLHSQEQFTRLWTKAQPVVSHYVHSMVRDSDAAKDVVQTTAITLLRKFTHYDPARDFLPWALGVAKFEVLSHRRDHARDVVQFHSELMDQLTEQWVEVAEEMSDQTAALQHCVTRLPEKSRQLVRLKYLEGLNSSELAERLNRKAGSIRVTLQRIREQLGVCVEQQMEAVGGLK